MTKEVLPWTDTSPEVQDAGFKSKYTPTLVDHGRGGLGGTQYVFHFPNGYGASLVVEGKMTYGGLEMAVLKKDEELTTDPLGMDKWSLCYDTPITNAVLGYLSGPAEVEELLDQISRLTPDGNYQLNSEVK